MGVEPKIGGKNPKMDGENNGKSMNIPIKWMIWGAHPLFLETPTFPFVPIPQGFLVQISTGRFLHGRLEFPSMKSRKKNLPGGP